VRALVRDPEKAKDLSDLGAEVVVADLGERASFEPALQGATGLYLLSPPDMGASDFVNERKAWLTKVAATIQAAKVAHVVFLSSIGAQHATGTGIIQTVYWGEQALREIGVPFTSIRAAYFVENWGAVVPVAKKDGVLPSFIPADYRMPMVATADVGRAAAQALLDGPRGVRLIELAGPSDPTPAEVAQTLSTVLGKPVQVVEAPLDAVVPTFTSFGFSSNIAGLYRDMHEGIFGGRVAPEAGNETRRGSTSLEQTLRLLAG
jgi:uncharacterized protein YbjT (DUF2867 family)